MHSTLPRYAGAALWAQTQFARLERPFKKLEEAARVLPSTPELEDLRSSYLLTLPQIEKFMRDKHQEWRSHCSTAVEATIQAGPYTSPLSQLNLKQLCTHNHSTHPSYTL